MKPLPSKEAVRSHHLWCLGALLTQSCVGNIFGHIDSKNGNKSQPKHWMLFIDIKLSTSLVGVQSSTTNMDRVLRILRVLSVNFERKSKTKVVVCDMDPYQPPPSTSVQVPTGQCVKSSTSLPSFIRVRICKKLYKAIDVVRTMTKPAFLASINSAKCSDVKSIKIVWKIFLQNQLRLNVTLLELKLKDVFRSWFRNLVVIDSTLSEETFVFGGIKSKVSVCPASKDVIVHFELAFVFPSSFFLVFNMVSKDVVRSVAVDSKIRRQRGTKLLWIQMMPVRGLTVCEYKIELPKYKLLQVGLKPQKELTGASVTVFDGPGLLSKRISINELQKTVTLTSFQCVLQILVEQKFAQKVQFFYFENDLPRESVNLNKEEFVVLEFRTTLNMGRFPRVFVSQGPSNSAVNVTITKFLFTDQPDNECLLGGGVIYEPRDRDHVQLYGFCNKDLTKKRVDWKVPWSVYSSCSPTVVVLYSYTEYSRADITMQISHTSCKIISLTSQCEKLLMKDSKKFLAMAYSPELPTVQLNPNVCSVFQFSSGMYRTFSKAPKEIYQFLTEKESFPSCEFLIRIKISSSEYCSHQFNWNIFRECHDEDRLFRLTDYSSVSSMAKMRMTFFSKNILKQTDQNVPLQIMSQNMPGAWHSTKHDVHAQIHFYSRRGILLEARLNYWTHSWVSCVILPSNISLTPAPIRVCKRVISRKCHDLPPNLNSAKVLILTLSIPNKMWKVKDVKFGLHVQQNMNRNVFALPYKRKWVLQTFRFTGRLLMGRLSFVFAPPGTLDAAALSVRRTFAAWKDHRSSSFCFSWQDGKSFHHQMKINEKGTGNISIQIGEYQIAKPCFRTKCVFSWKEASKYCRRLQSNLPEILSRKDQEDILNMLKNTNDLFVIRGIFIALKSQR